MDIKKAIRERRAIRAFKPTPAPKEILQEMMETALWAPSFGNSQPWEFIVLGGRPLEELRAALREQARRDSSGTPDIPWSDLKIEPYRRRRRELGFHVLQAKGINREDKEARDAWRIFAAGFFDAPNAIIIYSELALGGWAIFDCGVISMAIDILAHEKGLGTCIQAAPVQYTEIIRPFLNLPQNKLIIVGIAIGYPDGDAPVNCFPRSRDPLESMVTWRTS